jgi:hypothetical protein
VGYFRHVADGLELSCLLMKKPYPRVSNISRSDVSPDESQLMQENPDARKEYRGLRLL